MSAEAVLSEPTGEEELDGLGVLATSNESYTYDTLSSYLKPVTSNVPLDTLVRLLLKNTEGTSWPVIKEACAALMRRIGSARSDALVVCAKPEGGAVLGAYKTRRKRILTGRPYNTHVSSLSPLSGSCDCPDYSRNSLGVCKHLWCVWDSLYSKPRRVRIGTREQDRLGAMPRIMWDPVKPMTGRGDWLERVYASYPQDMSDAELCKAMLAARGLFKESGEDGRALLDISPRDSVERRFEVVDVLCKTLKSLEAAKGGTNSICSDPALYHLLSEERSRLKSMAKGHVSVQELGEALAGLHRHLYNFQRLGLERFLKTERLLLADDMGLGKTTQAIACAHVMWSSSRAKRGLVIVPASLKFQWMREWVAVTPTPITLLEGGPRDRQAILKNCKSGFILMNYEQLLRGLDDVQDWDPQMVILDEAQKIKNWATKSARYVKMLNPRYRIVLTGTPMENRLEELASIVEWVDSHAMEPKWRLVPAHTAYADGRDEVAGAKNLSTIRERLGQCMLRRVRKEILDQLPSRTDTVLPVVMTKEQIESHDSLSQPIAQLMQIRKKRPLLQSEFLKLMSLFTTQRVISNGLVQLNFENMWPAISGVMKPEDRILAQLNSPKLIEFRGLIKEIVIQQGRKCVIFSQWRRMLRLASWVIGDVLSEAGYRFGFFSGEESQKKRTQNIVDFHDDDQMRVLFATDAGGVGLNLQKASNCVINLELPWNPAVLEQRISRIYRIGQTDPIDVYNLVSTYGIEARICQIVSNKKALFDGLFDGDSDEVDFESSASFLDMIGTSSPEYMASLVEDSEVESNGFEEEEDWNSQELGEVSGNAQLSADLENLIDVADEHPDVKESRREKDLSKPEAAKEDAKEESTSAMRYELASHDEAEASPASSGAEISNHAVSHESADPRSSTIVSDASVGNLLSKIKISMSTEGELQIKAAPEAALPLAQLFAGMADLLRKAAGQ